MNTLPQETIRIIDSLQKNAIRPILYGSQGVSLYLGAFKEFGDIDLLVRKEWLQERWEELVATMSDLGFVLHDEHEHEFIASNGLLVAFAGSDILTRDRISRSVEAALATIDVEHVAITTLKPESFLNAYEFSAKDGYRKNFRHK
ncbi:hypothetical protein KBD87_03275 [Candidatus Saccharibacteria bacterium]|jgi:hypothetical protein|nr:hypothetical protein [Candidatus Saccharibacteria bacterium]